MNLNRMATAPLNVERSTRPHGHKGLTSLPAGKMVPLMAVPLYREDSARGTIRVSFEMMETAEILMNAVNVRVMAYAVPWLAMDRFEGSMDQFDRSYAGKPKVVGGATVPFFENLAYGAAGDDKILNYLGLHGQPGDLVNTMYLEAYNQIWNMRAANRSRKITPRGRLQKDLAPAFWLHQDFAHMVADFDQSVMDGRVALNVANGKLPVKGIGIETGQVAGLRSNIREAGGTGTSTYASAHAIRDHGSALSAGQAWLSIKNSAASGALGAPDIFAELQQNGITISLSNIELAKKTQAFARLREQYEAVDDPDGYIIDMLMAGLSIPDQSLKQPMLLGENSTVFGMSKRYATDGANLTKNVVNGATYLDVSVNMPKISTGAIIMLVAEITPEQLFERQQDPFLHIIKHMKAGDVTGGVSGLPNYQRDYLDPEKVDVVKNGRIDTSHATPNDTFGFEHLNARHAINRVAIGGPRFIRPAANTAFDEDRQRIWSCEVVNPRLTQDFYLCTTIHQKPFVVTNQDPFEAVIIGQLAVNGLTVFGAPLIEAANNYDKVMANAPTDRIVKA